MDDVFKISSSPTHSSNDNNMQTYKLTIPNSIIPVKRYSQEDIEEGEEEEEGELLEESPQKQPTLLNTKFTGASHISNYSIQKMIGEGTFGQVLIASHCKTSKVYALKKLILHNSNEGLAITTLREIQILKKLNHPNIISLNEMAYEKGDPVKKLRGQLYMVFPYMDHDLTGLLENPAVKFSPAQIKSYIYQILSGLEYMHNKKFIHRDIKGSNILIDNSGCVKIGDFGLARQLSSDENPKYTNLVVTRWYRPPELLMGECQYDFAVDIWGAGCIFGEILRRRPLLAGSTDFDQLDKIVKLCGTPTEETWPGLRKLPIFDPVKGAIDSFKIIHERAIRQKFPSQNYDKNTVDFLDCCLVLNPKKRPSASQAMNHRYFLVEPELAKPGSSDFKPFPTSHELDAKKAREEFIESSRFLPGATRPALPFHYDALPSQGSYFPIRQLIRPESRNEKYTDGHSHRDRRTRYDYDDDGRTIDGFKNQSSYGESNNVNSRKEHNHYSDYRNNDGYRHKSSYSRDERYSRNDSREKSRERSYERDHSKERRDYRKRDIEKRSGNITPEVNYS